MHRLVLGFSLLLNIWLVTYMLLAPHSEGASNPAPPAAQPTPTATPQPAPPPTQGAGGYNLIWPSEDFAHANWGPLENASVEPNSDVAPDGTRTATRLVELAASGRHRIEGKAGGLQPGAPYVLSLYVKPAPRTGVMLEMRDEQQHRYGTVRFDLEAQRIALKSGDATNAGIDAAPNGWVRCWAMMPYEANNAYYSFAVLGPPDLAPAYAGDGKSGILIWGAQLDPAGPLAYAATTEGPALPH